MIDVDVELLPSSKTHDQPSRDIGPVTFHMTTGNFLLWLNDMHFIFLRLSINQVSDSLSQEQAMEFWHGSIEMENNNNSFLDRH
jgi:hypothetical protein